MRTTLTLDDDVAVLLRELQHERSISFREAVNEALRAGLIHLVTERVPREPYRLKPVSLGRCNLPSLDNVAEALSIAEGEEHG
ncbi:MAG: DUF2191 domain-containing protein [Acidobacteriota bacterium]|nr:DUF2191 domain-containing protein [Acidobacteriota bacterium]